MTPFACENASSPATYIFHRLVTSGEIAVYDQIFEACAVRTDSSLAWPTIGNAVFNQRARRRFWVTPSPNALLRMRGAPECLETGPQHADLVNKLHGFMSGAGPVVLAGYGERDEPFLRECGYRSLAPTPFVHPESKRIDVRLMAGVLALIAPEGVSFRDIEGDAIASLAAVLKANGFDVEEFQLLEARAFVAATMALASRLRERAPEAFAGMLACADPANVRSITNGGPCLHASIRGGRTQVRALLPIALAAPGGNLRCVDLAGFLAQSDAEIRAGKSPRDLRIVVLRPDRHEIVLPLTGASYSDPLRQLLRRSPGSNRAFLAPSVDELQACGRKLRAFGRLLGVLDDLFRDRALGDQYPDAPVDELRSEGSSPYAIDAFLLRLFHAAPTSARAALIAQVRDSRLRELARRIVWDAAGHDGIARNQLGDYVQFKRKRLLGRVDARWRTVAAARQELAELIRQAQAQGAERVGAISRYLDFLEKAAAT